MSPAKKVLDEIEEVCTNLKNALEDVEKPLEIINKTDHVLSVVLRTLKTSRDAILLMEFIPVLGEIVMPIEIVIFDVLFPLRDAKKIVHKVNKKMKKVNEKLERIEERVDKVLEVVQKVEDAGDVLRQLKELLVTIDAMKKDSGDLANTHPFIESLKFSVGANGTAYSSVQDVHDEYEKKEPENGWFRHTYWRFKEIRAMKSAMEDVIRNTDMKGKHDKTTALAKDHDNKMSKHVKGYDKKMDNHISIIEKVHDMLIELMKHVDIVPSSKPDRHLPLMGEGKWVNTEREYYPALFDTCHGLIPGGAHRGGKYGWFTYNTNAIKVEDPALIHMIDPTLYSLSLPDGKKPEGLKAQGWQNDNHGHDYSMVMVRYDNKNDHKERKTTLFCGKYSDAKKFAAYNLDGKEFIEYDLSKIQFVYPTPINERHDNKDFDYYSPTDLDFLDAGAHPMNTIDLGKHFKIEEEALVHLEKQVDKLSGKEAERQMKTFIDADTEYHIACFDKYCMGGYTIRLFKAEGVIQLKEYSGDHGVRCDRTDFKYLVKVK